MRKSNKIIILVLLFILLNLFFISIALGRYPINLADVFKAILYKISGNPLLLDEKILQIIFNVRLPRIIAAILVGSALSVSGACYQGVFRNPMASPALLGVSSGAGFGAALGILSNFSILGVQSSSFIFGIVSVLLVYSISYILSGKTDMILTLLLTGMVISTLFSSLISLLKFVGDPYDDLPAITFWLMGSISNVSIDEVKIVAVVVIIGISALYVIKWKINILSFSEQEASSMGIHTSKLRIIIILCSTLITAAVVSISGLIGWVGLVVPHLVRMIVGPNYKYLIPTSVVLGGIYMLVIDDISRTIFPGEIPLGILTSIIGTPFFIYLLAKGKKGWR